MVLGTMVVVLVVLLVVVVVVCAHATVGTATEQAATNAALILRRTACTSRACSGQPPLAARSRQGTEPRKEEASLTTLRRVAVGKYVVVSLSVAFLTACGGDGDPAAPATTRATAPTVLPPLSPVAPKLSKAEACRQFTAITADFRMTDEQSAAAFGALARQTADPALAAAIQRVADAFARRALSIPSNEVQAMCR